MMAAAAMAAAAEAAARDLADSTVIHDREKLALSAATAALDASDGMQQACNGVHAGIEQLYFQRQIFDSFLFDNLSQDHAANNLILADMVEDESGNMERLLQQMVAERQLQRQFEEELAAVAAAETAMMARPEEHFLTISQNGIILEATIMVTGFLPKALLMTSAYESVHYDDLQGFLAVKRRYWDNGNAEVGAYLRRQTIEGDWVWLLSKVASYINNAVPGFIIHECRVYDERAAETVSRTTRITAGLIQAVKDAVEWKRQLPETDDRANNSVLFSDSMMGPAISGLADDAAALRALLTSAALDIGIDFSSGSSSLEQLVEAAASGGTFSHDSAMGKDAHLIMDTVNKRKAADTPTVLDVLRLGPCFDISKIELSLAELKLVVLVLSGKLQMKDIDFVVISAMSSLEKDLAVALEGYVTEIEKENMNTFHSHRKSNRRFSGKDSGGRDRDVHSGASDSHSISSFDTAQSRARGNNKAQIKTNSFSGLHQVSRHKSGIASDDIQHDVPLKPKHISAPLTPADPPPIAVINLSFSSIGNIGMEMLCEVLYMNTPALKTIDISFCGVEERGFLAMCRALKKRKLSELPSLQGLLLTGNDISYKSAKELGIALSLTPERRPTRKRQPTSKKGEFNGYDEDDEFDDDDENEGYDDIVFGGGGGRRTGKSNEDSASKSLRRDESANSLTKKNNPGLQLLHLGCTSLSAEALYQLLIGLGQDCTIRELSIPSNKVGAVGATLLVAFLEGRGIEKYNKGQPVMPFLNRLDFSNNNLGNDGTAKLTRAISKRGEVSMVDLHLSLNNIGAGGIETILNKLLQHNLVTLSLDNNVIGDRGCQLVAASLPSMHHLSRLNLSFNQIGSRGVTTLMRALIGCESITYLGLSGNVMKISGAIAMGFALAQHPRLAELELDNCCLSQVAQCHIVAGIISNRWVPMRRMNGFRAGPPMVAIGALEVLAQHLNNEECFRTRRDIQMKIILQWMESNRAGKMTTGVNTVDYGDAFEENKDFLTADFVSGMTDVNNAPSQNAYLRMLDWLSRIPFDEDELNDLRKYFYETDGGDGGDGLRGSDGNINLKCRGDLLAALGSELAEEIRDTQGMLEKHYGPSVGLVIDSDAEPDDDGGRNVFEIWNSIAKSTGSPSSICRKSGQRVLNDTSKNAKARDLIPDTYTMNVPNSSGSGKKRRMGSNGVELRTSASSEMLSSRHNVIDDTGTSSDMGLIQMSSMSVMGQRNSVSSLSKQSVMSGSESERSTISQGERTNSSNALKTRITMFPQFAAKLDLLKASAQDMMDNEIDPVQQDVIAQQFAEASLTLLRQLRYHCMNSGLDGWRLGKIRRKVLIVDDSIVTRKMVARAFEKANFIVDTAENGMEGVEKLKESIYDIAFMDIDMPVMNGFDATKALRDWEDAKRPGARQPICALTAAYVDDFERDELMKFKNAGLDVMESKPCNIPRLFKVVDDVSPMFSDLSISLTQQLGTTTC